MLGFPSSISNFVSPSFSYYTPRNNDSDGTTQKQQAGRAGRRSGDSLAIMVADPFPVDQYYVAHPAELFEGSLDDLVINVNNDLVLEGMGDELIRVSSAYLSN